MSGKEECRLEDLIEFPCDYLFKVFGPAEPEGLFVGQVKKAVENTLPVSLDAIKTRRSSQGTYVAVSVLVRISNFHQINEIYSNLRRLENVKYLL